MEDNSEMVAAVGEGKGTGNSVRIEGDWIDIGEAARRLGVSEKTVRRRIKAGRIGARKIRGVWFVSVTESDAKTPSALLAPPEQKHAPEPLLHAQITHDEQHIERLKKVERDISYILNKLSDLDRVLDERDRNLTSQLADIQRQGETIDRLTEENRKLQEEVLILREEAIQLRQNTPKDIYALKDRMEEIMALKATIASNQRGLALLRDEVQEKQKSLQERENQTLILQEKVRVMESQTARRRKNWLVGLPAIPKRYDKNIKS
jgi:excisionase family DNA binding protein